MWHEIHYPRRLSETTASTIKQKEILSWCAERKLVSEAFLSAGLPGSKTLKRTGEGSRGGESSTADVRGNISTLLIHGPPGNGKLALLQALCSEYGIDYKVLHCGTSTLEEFETFLGQALEEMLSVPVVRTSQSSVTVEKELDRSHQNSRIEGINPDNDAIVIHDSDDDETVDLHSAELGGNLESKVSAPPEVRKPKIFVVKELPIAPNYVIHPILNRVTARLGAASSKQNFERSHEHHQNSSSRSDCLQKQLSPLVGLVFVHTTHDTHSTKLELNNMYSQNFMAASGVVQTHLPPVTQRALVARLSAVLLREGKTANPNFLEKVYDATKGDIRQALLQLQWISLIDSRLVSSMPLGGLSATTGTAQGRRKKRVEKNKTVVDEASNSFLALLEGGSQAPAPTPISSTPPVSSAAANFGEVDEAAILQALRRDDTIDVAHASARVLTQKYTTIQVASELTSDSMKLLGYVSSNLPLYFAPNQLDQFAMSCSQLSYSDSRLPGGSEGLASGVGLLNSASSLFAERDEIAESTSRVGCGDIALHTFGVVYRKVHKEVSPPKGMTPHYPLKYQPSAYPRMSEIRGPPGVANGRPLSNSSYGSEPILPPPRLLREQFSDTYDATRSPFVWITELGPFASFINLSRNTNCNSLNISKFWNPSLPPSSAAAPPTSYQQQTQGGGGSGPDPRLAALVQYFSSLRQSFKITTSGSIYIPVGVRLDSELLMKQRERRSENKKRAVGFTFHQNSYQTGGNLEKVGGVEEDPIEDC